MEEKIQFNEIVRQAIKATGLSSAQFAVEAGFLDAGRIYRALKPKGVKLGIDSLETILNRFPELNGDRFIRRSGPVLLKDLQKENDIVVEKKEQSFDENIWKILAQERLKNIERLEKQNDILLKLLENKI